MAVAFPLTEVLDADQIVALAMDRQQQYRVRDALYDKFLGYYFGGEDTHPASSYTPPILAMDSKGRPLMRPFEIGSSIESKRGYNSKRLAPIVDDYQSLKGRMPSTRVVPPSAPNGEEKADLLTKYLYSTYEMSDMLRQQAEAGFWMSLLGDALYILEPANADFNAKRPDPKGWRVVWTVYSPRIAYPTFYRGFRRFQVYDVLMLQEWSAWDINHTFRDYGIRVREDAPSEERCVITYLSPYQRTIVVGQQYARRGPHNEWDLGFCPAAWAYNKTPGAMGMADIAHSLDQQDFLNFLMSVMADGIVNMTYPIVARKGGIGETGTDQLLRGPDAPLLELEGPDSDIIVRSTQGDIQAAMGMVQHTLDDITAGTGSSTVRQTGDMKSSIVTGRAIHATQGPQSTRIDTWQQSMTAVIQRLNSMTLEMQEKAPYLKNFKGDVFGSHHGRSFQVPFDAVDDIDGWYRNTVRWEGLVGMNDQQKISVAYEGLAAKLWDRPYARELAGVDDPLGMDARIEQDLLTDARIQADVQKIMEGGQSPQSGGTPTAGGAPAGGSPAPHGGRNAGPPPEIFRPPGMWKMQGGGFAINPGQVPKASPPSTGGGALQSQGAPSPLPKTGADRDSIKRALVGIAATLKGNVYAIDDLAFEGTTQTPRIAVTDFRDQTKVTNALKPLIPNIKVTVLKGDIPTEAVQLI